MANVATRVAPEGARSAAVAEILRCLRACGAAADSAASDARFAEQHDSRKTGRWQLTTCLLLFGLLIAEVAAGDLSAADIYFKEMAGREKVSPSENLFGDIVNPQTGGLSFTQADIYLPGIGPEIKGHPNPRRAVPAEFAHAKLVVLRELASHREAKIVEGHLMSDHVHMCISIPPKYSVSSVVGYIKGKSAIQIARQFGRKQNFTGENFWARGYFVSTVGLDEAMVRAYIRHQEQVDERYDQMKLGG